MKAKFTPTEMEVIGHRLEVMDDILYDVWELEIEARPELSEILEEGLEFLLSHYEEGKGMRFDFGILEENMKFSVIAILSECLLGGTLLDIADDSIGDRGGVTPQKVTALYRADRTAKDKIKTLVLGGIS